MTKFSQRSTLLLAATLNLSLLAPGALAKDTAWSGGGDDSYWSTSANWNNGSPVNNDIPIFEGTARQNNTNDLSGLIFGPVTFNTGGFVLNGNPFRINGSATAFITNAAGLNIISNDLTFGGAVAKYWFVAPGSEVRLTGVITNLATPGTSIGWLNLTNGGTVRIMNSAKSVRGMDLFQGTVIVDGNSALVDANNDGIVFKPPTGSTVNLIITNNGTVRIGGGGNFRMGNGRTVLGAAAGSGSTSVVNLDSGTLELYGPNVSVYAGDTISGATGIFNQNGGLVWGSAGNGNSVTLGNAAGADGTYNLNGGVLWIARVRQGNAGAANATFNFNGGTLKPTVEATDFFQGVQNANVQDGGAIIDTTNLNITIAQNLQAAGSGGLTKLGSGTLTLTGFNSYTGPTVVNDGTLEITTSTLLGGGGITVASGGALNIASDGTSIGASAVHLGADGGATLNINLANGNSSPAIINTGTLNASGSVTVNITGDNFSIGQFPLIQFTSASGLGNIHLGSIKPGLSATLVQTATSLELNIVSSVKSLVWSGATDDQWNTTSENWYDVNNGYVPAAYSQSGGFGDVVTFDDTLSGSPNINLTLAVSPVAIALNNNAFAYTFSGSGKISGVGSVTKDGFQPVTFATLNDYSGGTIVNAGPLYLGADQALGTGPVTVNFGTIASDSNAARSLPNVVTQTADLGVVFGDTVNSGTVTLAGGLDLDGGKARTLEFNSDVVLAGPLSNGAFKVKLGPGRLIIKADSQQNALVNHQQGDVIIDGARFDNLDGWRLQNTTPGTTLRMAVTNGALFTVTTNSANFRIGQAGGDNSAGTVNILDVSATINLTPSAAMAGNSALIIGGSGDLDVLNLLPGGNIITRVISGGSPGNTEAHFNGGKLTAINNQGAFINGLTNAFIENGGLTIDTTNASVTVPQALLAAGSGGLTKLGAGTLILTGSNTYTGPTIVEAGKLVLGENHAASGSITVNADSTLAFLQTSITNRASVSSVTIGNGANSALEAQLTSTNAPVGNINSLILNGSVAVNVSGPVSIGQFPLFSFGTISGSGNLSLGQIPQGTVAQLVTNVSAKTIDLVVSSVTPTLWNGIVNGNWDTTTTNWTSGGTPVSFAQLAPVLFDDTASSTNVNLTTTLTPSQIVVSNDAVSYQFSGSGSLSGSTGLTKYGTNDLTISTANTFSGDVTINAGTIALGNATALGSGSDAIEIKNGGALDNRGFQIGARQVNVSGNGVNNTGALLNTGGDQNDSYRNVVMTGDTTIGGSGVLGIRASSGADIGLVGNGHKLIKTGSGQLNLNGGMTIAGLTNIWFDDLGDIDIQQGTISFERRAALGRPDNIITVEEGAAILLFSLNQELPVPMNSIVLNNGAIEGSGVVSDINILGGAITLNGPANSVSIVPWVGTTGPTLLYLNGPIGGSGGVTFSGAINGGVLRLSGNNTYTGMTTITNGSLTLAAGGTLIGTTNINLDATGTLDVSEQGIWTLGADQTLSGSGTVNGNVLANGTVAPGNGIGTLTVNGDLTLAGDLLIEVDKSLSPANDVISVAGNISHSGNGVVTMSNNGANSLAVNDRFILFNQPVANGDAMQVVGANATWRNDLATDGSVTVLTVSGVSTTPVTITNVVSGGNLNLSWPADHIGWRLEVQTNSLSIGLSNNWSVWPGSTTTNKVSIPVSTENPTMFFRLVY
ncbi:MAG TPA: autotransporter-associated beta strand repeat-containing protein [Verrucomicrobiae bacterium]|nr:autotransporter-associated beta strand repeat-containing protein [Verrucomicrobiae bacterium]